MSAEVKKNREFSLSENVSEGSVSNIIKEIREINRHDDEQEKEKREYEREPITIVVNTFGGSVYDGFGLVAAIELSKTPVHTVCLGKAMSMGFIIFAAGHKRFAHRLATLMYHEVSTFVWDKLSAIKQEVHECERLQKDYDDYILDRTNILQEKLDEVKEKKAEWYLNAKEAKKYGLVDELLEPAKVS